MQTRNLLEPQSDAGIQFQVVVFSYKASVYLNELLDLNCNTGEHI